MRLTKLIIRNYKSIKHLEIDDFQNLNVFIGKNDAGKSNIFRALDILFNSNIHDYSGSMSILKEDLMETVYEGSSIYHFFNKKNHEAEITAYLELSDSEISRYGLSSDEEDKTLVVSKKLLGEKNHTRILVNFMRLNRNVIVKAPDEKKRFLKRGGSYTDLVDECVGRKFLEELENEFILIPADRNIVRDPHPLSEKVRVESYMKDSLINLANSDDENERLLFNQFIQFIGKISPLIEIIDPVVENKRVVDIKFKTGKNEEIPLSTIGGGNNELLLLLHEIIISGGRILAIEEPEIHLHPEAERKLFRFMDEFSQTTQIFVVTHSPVFVEPMNLRGLHRVVKKDDETIIYSMNQNDYVDRNRLEQELNTENCEMFFADKVLLVEGISDKILMEGLIDKYCKSTDEIKVISAFSKDNFEVYIDLLRIFKIPYKVMTDLDALKGRYKIKIIWRELREHSNLKNRYERISFLKLKHIHVLSQGDLERSYPKRFRRGLTKPLDALFALHHLTDEDYNSDKMKDLREVIEALEE
ncbi:MAG: AAA family ATPase [archaeon]